MRFLILALGLLSFLGGVRAEQTAGEAVKAEAKAAKRKMKKGVHSVEEKMCGKMTGDSKVECMAKAAKHRVDEGVDSVKDKATEVKDKVDK